MNKLTLMASLVCLISGSAMANTTNEMPLDPNEPLAKVAPYPEAQEGFTRHVIYLPKLDIEATSKVELLIGQSLEVDCNLQSFGGELEEKTLEGWGYNYFELSELKGPMSTMMACPADSKHKEFVTVRLGDKQLQRYNSKLPIVVYIPKDVEVKYRIWDARSTIEDAIVK